MRLQPISVCGKEKEDFCMIKKKAVPSVDTEAWFSFFAQKKKGKFRFYSTEVSI